jgi:AraC-like DNA-binding protein
MVITPHKIRAILIALKGMGIKPDTLLAGSGTDWRAIRDLVPMTLADHSRALDWVVGQLPVDMATRCGRRTRLRDFGLAGTAMALCATVSDALSFWARYSRLSNHVLTSDVQLSEARGELRLVPNIPMTPRAWLFCLDYSVASFEATYRQLTGTEAPPLVVTVPRAVDAERRFDGLTLEALQCVDRPFASVSLPRNAFQRAVVTSDVATLGVIHAGCEKTMAVLQGEDILARVTAVIGATRDIPTIDEVAGTLGMSVPHLRQLLDETGRTFFQIVDEHRRNRARDLLGDGIWLQKEITHSLGYGEAGSFRRALRRWSQTDPVLAVAHRGIARNTVAGTR